MLMVYLDLLEFKARPDLQDQRESLVFLEDLVVQAGWGLKEREGTLQACRDFRALQGCRAAQEYSTAPKEPCSPSPQDPTANRLVILMELLQ